ncbi:MAG: hypothetical protein IH845_01610 [Nanoarchaeota archaeon]|nr:hypothetical protein [Nanoarchaeota archaeon]
MKYFFIILILATIVSSLEVEINCPKEVEVEEEFKCSFEILDSAEVYDVKIDITKDGSSVARIFDPQKNDWKSAYYYLSEFSESEILLKITEEGKYSPLLKLRKGSFRESVGFDILVGVSSSFEEKIVEEIIDETQEEEALKNLKENKIVQPEKIILKNERSFDVISLNAVFVEENSTLIYESREARNFKYLPYVFSLFLVVVIVFLLWEKF